MKKLVHDEVMVFLEQSSPIIETAKERLMLGAEISAEESHAILHLGYKITRQGIDIWRLTLEEIMMAIMAVNAIVKQRPYISKALRRKNELQEAAILRPNIHISPPSLGDPTFTLSYNQWMSHLPKGRLRELGFPAQVKLQSFMRRRSAPKTP